jgi:mono/diheme cytochrome c family protein
VRRLLHAVSASKTVTFGKVAGTALLAGVIAAVLVVAAAAHPTGGDPAKISFNGKALYRTYCGKCHALSAALSAGFGSAGGGLGVDGGPSFNDLRVPASYTILAITEPTGGHERLHTRLSVSQVKAVAAWLARTTAHNPLPSLPTDG